MIQPVSFFQTSPSLAVRPAIKKRVDKPLNQTVAPQADSFVKFGYKDYFRQKNIDTSLDSTKISYGDPQAAKLIYRGYDIKDLAQYSNFQETAFLVLHGKLPTFHELKTFEQNLASRRELPDSTIELLKQIGKRYPDAHPMRIFETGLTLLGLNKSTIQNQLSGWNEEQHMEKTLDLIAKAPTLIAYSYRLQKGKDIVHPDPNLSHAANFLYMLNGKVPDPTVAKIFEKTLICYMDHGFNASTLSARAAASTGSSIFSAVTAGSGALSGRFHGGANEAVSRQLMDVQADTESNIENYVQRQVQSGEKIYGFGHKKYKSSDPRVKILSDLADQLAAYYRQQGVPETDPRLKWQKTGNAFRDYMQNDFRKKIPPNVDFPIGYLYPMLEIPVELNTPIFAMSRVVGWSAHIGELQQDNTVYSPLGAYKGEKELTYPIQHG
ncbi:MAG: citrate synthase [Vampirovibrio sp.]|jgi:citrate synthase|nr:citrate synthase [Vampirovibrio sp.]